jgi:hypothetical protein
MFYSTNQKSSVAIFIGKPIPTPDRFLSKDSAANFVALCERLRQKYGERFA